MTRPAPARARDLTWLVALSSALWGTDALLRKPLTTQLPTPLIVVLEHAVCVLLLSPLLPRAYRGWRTLTGRQRLAMIGVGAGASAAATTLFTLAFTRGDAITPLVLQKLQPLIAIGLAGLLLGERLHRRYLLFVAPALAGAWLLTFPDPLHVGLASAEAALLAVGAAVLWAAGTVLGRLVSAQLDPTTLTVLRFAIGLPTAVLIAFAGGRRTGADSGPARAAAVLPRPAPHAGVAGHTRRVGVSGDGGAGGCFRPGGAVRADPVARGRVGRRRGDRARRARALRGRPGGAQRSARAERVGVIPEGRIGDGSVPRRMPRVPPRGEHGGHGTAEPAGTPDIPPRR